MPQPRYLAYIRSDWVDDKTFKFQRFAVPKSWDDGYICSKIDQHVQMRPKVNGVWNEDVEFIIPDKVRIMHVDSFTAPDNTVIHLGPHGDKHDTDV